MREHNRPTISHTTLNYNIESLAVKDASNSKPKQQPSKLTEVKPFDFETNRRAMLALEGTEPRE